MQSDRSEAKGDLEGPAPALPGARVQGRPEAAGPAVGRILVGLDRSATSGGALAHAAAMARAFEAQLTLLHVIESRARALEPADALGWEITRAESQQYLERLRAELAGRGLEATTALTQGDPAEQILAAARDHGADLIVLGSHEEPTHAAWSLGGTARKVAARAGASVLIVPVDAAPESAVCERILLPLDGSPRAECVLPAALGLARATRATIGLAHVVREPEIFRTTLPSAADLELVERLERRNGELAERYLHNLAARLRAEGFEVETFLEHGDDPHRLLNELAEREHFELIALAAHGRTGAATRAHGAVAARFLSERSRPLLVVQDLSGPERRDRAAQAAASYTAPRLGGLHHELKP